MAQNAFLIGFSDSFEKDTFKTLGTLKYNEIALLNEDSVVQLSSTSSADTSITVSILGEKDTGEEKGFDITTDATDGQIAVNSGSDVIHRITKMRVTSLQPPEGDIYVTVSGATLENGEPIQQEDYLFSIKAGTFVSNIPVFSGDYSIQFDEIFISACYNGLQNARVVVQWKYHSNTQWQDLVIFPIKSGTNTNISWIMETLDTLFPFSAMDVRIVAKKKGFGALECFASLKLIYTPGS